MCFTIKSLNKSGKVVVMGSKRVFPMIYIRTNDLKSKNYEFVVGCSNENQKENIKMIIEKFNYFKDDLDKNEFMCK